MKTAVKVLMIMLIIFGIAVTVANLIPPVHASQCVEYGTIVEMPVGWICVGTPRDCCIVHG